MTEGSMFVGLLTVAAGFGFVAVILGGYVIYWIFLGPKYTKNLRIPSPSDYVVLESNSPALSRSGPLTQSVGISAPMGGFTPLLECNSAQPVVRVSSFATAEDKQAQITIQFYRGNGDTTASNTFIGEATISAYTPVRSGEPVMLIFLRAAERDLSLAAVESGTGQTLALTCATESTAALDQAIHVI